LVITPRMLVVCNNRCLLTEVRKEWYGLPRGKLNANEVSGSKNLLSKDGLDGVFRELREETGEKLSSLVDDVLFLGLSETWKVLDEEKKAINHINLIWCLDVPEKIVSLNKNVWINLDEIDQINLFPDAEMAISVFNDPKLHHLRGGWIYPDKKYVYMDKNAPISLSSNPPSWLAEAWLADTIPDV